MKARKPTPAQRRFMTRLNRFLNQADKLAREADRIDHHRHGTPEQKLLAYLGWSWGDARGLYRLALVTDGATLEIEAGTPAKGTPTLRLGKAALPSNVIRVDFRARRLAEVAR